MPALSFEETIARIKEKENDPEYTAVYLDGPEINDQAIKTLTDNLKNNDHVNLIDISNHGIKNIDCVYPLLRSNGKITAFKCQPLPFKSMLENAKHIDSVRYILRENENHSKKSRGSSNNILS